MPYAITQTCTGCSACTRLCPVFAISGERGKVHAVNAKRCISCGVCGYVCPKGAVMDSGGSTAAKLAKPLWPKPVIDTSGCTACAMCVYVCTKGAIEISPPQYQGDIDVFATLANPQKCVGCGLCKTICPMRVIAMEAPTPAESPERRSQP